jgi:hypothetical protein
MLVRAVHGKQELVRCERALVERVSLQVRRVTSLTSRCSHWLTARQTDLRPQTVGHLDPPTRGRHHWQRVFTSTSVQYAIRISVDSVAAHAAPGAALDDADEAHEATEVTGPLDVLHVVPSGRTAVRDAIVWVQSSQPI